MAYKYKLVTEVDPSAFQKAASAVPSTVNKINVGKKISGEQFGELENILKEKGLDDDTIADILDTWAERHLFVNPNEGVDPLDAKMQDLLKRFKDEDEKSGESKPDPDVKNTLKEQGKANLAKEVLTRLKEAKKEDRCKRIADRKYDKPSAYKSGAIVRCRQGKIWKDIK